MFGLIIGYPAYWTYLCDAVVSLRRALEDRVAQITGQGLHHKGDNCLPAHDEAEIMGVEAVRGSDEDLGKDGGHDNIRAEQYSAEYDEV